MGDDCKDTTTDKIIMLTTSVAPQGISTGKKTQQYWPQNLS